MGGFAAQVCTYRFRNLLASTAMEHAPEKLPYLITEQMGEVDRAVIEDYHIELIQMMENAGRNLAHLARERFLEGNPTGRDVCAGRDCSHMVNMVADRSAQTARVRSHRHRAGEGGFGRWRLGGRKMYRPSPRHIIETVFPTWHPN